MKNFKKKSSLLCAVMSTYHLNLRALTICLALALLVSCQDTEPFVDSQPEIPVPSVRLEAQTLHFKDVNSFTETMAMLNQKSENQIKQWLEELSFSESLFMQNVDAEQINTAKKTLDIPDPSLRAILNIDGLYVIGNEAHKISEDAELAQPIIADVLPTAMSWDKNELITRTPIVYGKEDYALEGQNNARTDLRKFAPYDGDFVYDAPGWPVQYLPYDINVGWLSAHIEAWNRTYAVYASAGLRIK